MKIISTDFDGEEGIEMSEKETIYQALFEAKQKMAMPRKNSKNDYFNSTYANLGEIMRAAIPALTDAGILVSERIRVDKDIGFPFLEMLLVLVNNPNESIASFWPLKPEKQTPQGYGSALSYGRRYLLQTMCGLTAEDDDGNAASQNDKEQNQNPPQQIPPQQTTQPQQTVDKTDFPQIATGYVRQVARKTGTKEDGTPWTRYGIQLDTGEWYNTFDKKYGQAAIDVEGQQLLVEIQYTLSPDSKYKNLQHLFQVNQQENPDEEIPF